MFFPAYCKGLTNPETGRTTWKTGWYIGYDDPVEGLIIWTTVDNRPAYSRQSSCQRACLALELAGVTPKDVDTLTDAEYLTACRGNVITLNIPLLMHDSLVLSRLANDLNMSDGRVVTEGIRLLREQRLDNKPLK